MRGAPAGQLFGFFGQGVGDQQTGQQIRLEGQRTEDDGHGHVVAGPVHGPDRVVGPDLARPDHPQVRTGPGGLRESLDPAGLF
jgi:hypothetical protein